MFKEEHEKLNKFILRNDKSSHIFPDAEDKTKSLSDKFYAGIQCGKFSFRKSKHQDDSMISKQALKGFTDIIIGNDEKFYILSGDKSITISALKFNIHNRDYPLHSMETQSGSHVVINKISNIIWLDLIGDVNDLFKSTKYTLQIKRSTKIFVCTSLYLYVIYY